MPKNEGRGVIAGVFGEEAEATRAIEGLFEAGFQAPDDLSVIVSHRREHEEVPVMYEPEVIQGAQAGALLGTVLAGAGATALGLAVGPISLLAAGPVVAAIEAAYAGGATGFAIGALLGLGLWKEEAEFHAAHIRDGVIWVGVHAEGERATMARQILSEAGAKHFTT